VWVSAADADAHQHPEGLWAVAATAIEEAPVAGIKVAGIKVSSAVKTTAPRRADRRSAATST
jgi:hypothetical protein